MHRSSWECVIKLTQAKDLILVYKNWLKDTLERYKLKKKVIIRSITLERYKFKKKLLFVVSPYRFTSLRKTQNVPKREINQDNEDFKNFFPCWITLLVTEIPLWPENILKVFYLKSWMLNK